MGVRGSAVIVSGSAFFSGGNISIDGDVTATNGSVTIDAFAFVRTPARLVILGDGIQEQRLRDDGERDARHAELPHDLREQRAQAIALEGRTHG